MMQPAGLFAADWLVIAGYAGLVLWIGLRVARSDPGRVTTFTVANRAMPTWVATGSLLATELSAATFLGVPHAGFTGDWSYLQLLVGALIGRIIVAYAMIRRYAALELVTVYQVFGQRVGPSSRRLAAALFLLGRLLASGVRLYLAGLAFSVATGLPLSGSILVAGLVAGIYTGSGGIRSVMWTDILQAGLFIVAAVACVWVALPLTGLDLAELYTVATQAGKTTIVQTPIFESSRSLGPALIGGLFLALAAQGTDQDLVQRLLTTKNRSGGAIAVVASGVLTIPLAVIFLLLGTCLWALYTAGMGLEPGVAAVADDQRVVAQFAATLMPVGLRGLVFAGLFAAAMSSLDSAIHALATTWITDIAPGKSPPKRLRRVTGTCTAALIATALGFIWYQQVISATSELNLVELALSAMSVIYGGLLGGVCVALFGRTRGSDRSCVAGMALGSLAGVLLFLQPLVLGEVAIPWTYWIPLTATLTIAIAWLAPRSRVG